MLHQIKNSATFFAIFLLQHFEIVGFVRKLIQLKNGLFFKNYKDIVNARLLMK